MFTFITFGLVTCSYVMRKDIQCTSCNAQVVPNVNQAVRKCSVQVVPKVNQAVHKCSVQAVGKLCTSHSYSVQDIDKLVHWT